jgi:hypothetical protein
MEGRPERSRNRENHGVGAGLLHTQRHADSRRLGHVVFCKKMKIRYVNGGGDPRTGRRSGLGLPFSKQRVLDTFAKATDYNEWNVQDASTIGVFVHPTEALTVAKKVPLSNIPGYEPGMGDDEVIGPVHITRAEIAGHFPELPLYTFRGADVVKLEASGPVPVGPPPAGSPAPWLARSCASSECAPGLCRHRPYRLM